MSIVNTIDLTGNLGADPEITKTTAGKTVAKFPLATNKTYKNDKGEKVSKTVWHNIVAFGQIAEVIQQYCKKGTGLRVRGESMPRSYEDSNGVKKYTHEVILDDFSFTDAKG